MVIAEYLTMCKHRHSTRSTKERRLRVLQLVRNSSVFRPEESLRRNIQERDEYETTSTFIAEAAKATFSLSS